MECFRSQFRAGRVLNGRYETVSPLNHGSFGMVIMAKDRVTGHDVAIKCLSKFGSPDIDGGFKVDDRSEELKIHAMIPHHPNIVNLLDSFETSSHVYIVLEYCSMGDLYEAIRLDKGPKQTEHVRDFMLQLIDSIEFLHGLGIYHRDIKPENVFLTAEGNMKIGDFGLATTDTWSYETAVGSDRYMAPEQFDHQGSGLSPARADIWSIGICLLNILFSRNPFGVPSPSDPLYADFALDRQTLFDVFPSMSQDTFEILMHCLAVDPAKRDLSLARDALERVVSFTTDDESLDEFCTENRDVVTATAGREPLRTPSVASPTMTIEGAFPWAKALHMQSIDAKISSIAEAESVSEDLFPGSEASTHDWLDKADAISFESNIDSGLGVSISSEEYSPDNKFARSKPVNIVGSLPARATSAIASIFGKKKGFESKSWSDLYEEDEEEELEAQRRAQMAAKPQPTKRPSMLSRHSKLSKLSQEDSSDDGRSTPRAYLSEIKNPPAADINTSAESLSFKDEDVSQHTGFRFDDGDDIGTPRAQTPRYSPPTKRSITDKWSALGEMRRRGAEETPSPLRNQQSHPHLQSQPQTPELLRDRFRPTTLRRKFTRQTTKKVDHSVWQQKEWNLSRDWRRSNQDLPRNQMHPGSQLDGASAIGNFRPAFMSTNQL